MKDGDRKAINSGVLLIQTAQSCSNLVPSSGWKSSLTLKQMKLVCQRTNCPSQWQSIRKKAKLAGLLSEKVVEHSEFLTTIRRKTFAEYLTMGLANVSTSLKRQSRKRKCGGVKVDESARRTPESPIETALAAAVHIIPSGSGGKLILAPRTSI
jgi:hypothetical protein